MKLSRIIPVLLLSGDGLVKTTKFKSPVYVGDPVNAVRIFNAKEADEIVILDIDATRTANGPSFERIQEIASEAFMPLGYGGGVTTLEHIEKLFKIGVEKIILNSSLHSHPDLLRNAVEIFGSQSLVASIDVRKDFLGRYFVYSINGKKKEKTDLRTFISHVQQQGAGEVIINSIDRDGTMSGYDLDLISSVCKQLAIPVVALGGAGTLADMENAIAVGASAVAAGSMFVFQGRHKAVLISYVNANDLSRGSSQFS